MKKLSKLKIAIVESCFRKEVSQELEKRCLQTFFGKGLKENQIDIFKVPGSWEIPLAVKKAASKKIYDAIITFGAIIKGDTYHFEQISNECARGCMEVSLEYGVPVIFEVLAVYDIKDALERATRSKENKGVEAALATLEMIKELSKI